VHATLTDYGLTGCLKRPACGIHQLIEHHGRFRVRARCRLAREVERRTARHERVERGTPRHLIDYNQNAKDRMVAAAYSVRPRRTLSSAPLN
jgi:hypothetical protein